MKTKLIPESKIIIPKWSKKLRNGDIDPIRDELDMQDFRYCVVGEGWGFTENYRGHCDMCSFFSMSIPQPLAKLNVKYNMIKGTRHYVVEGKPQIIDRMISRTNKFLEHYIKKHKK